MSADVLAYRLLESIDLEDKQKHLIRATIFIFSYDGMKRQLKKVSDNCELDDTIEKTSAKLSHAKEDISSHVLLDPFYTERSCTSDVKYKTMCDNGLSINPTYQIKLSHTN